MTRTRSAGHRPALAVPESAALVLFALILLIGGAGDTAHRLTALAQSAALGLIFLCLLAPDLRGRGGETPMWLLAGVIALLPVVHLLPLPPAIWAAAPGREPVAALMALAGVPSGWRAFSLDPQMTAEAGLELLPLLAALLLGWRAGPGLRAALVALVVVTALLSALIGAAQRLGGESAVIGAVMPGDAPGLFINRNHQALFLLMAIPLAAWLGTFVRARGWSGWRTVAGLLGGVALVLLAGTLATGSRAGLLLMPLALAAGALVAMRRGGGSRSAWAVIALLGLALGAAALSRSEVAQRPLERLLGQEDDIRPMVRDQTMQLIDRSWPAGSGIGSYVRVWPSVEPADSISAAYVNHAHNDYLELVAEGGVPALLLGVALLGIALWAWRRRHAGRPAPGDSDDMRASQGPLRAAALAALGLVAVHSLVDFPLRLMTLGAVTGLLLALALRPADAAAATVARAIAPSRPRAALLVVLLLAMLGPVWGLAMSRHALANGDASAALAAWPWSGEARTDAGFAALNGGRIGEGAAQARAAIAAAPLNARAYALLVLALESRGETAQSRALIAAARKLGHREPRLEYRAMEMAVDAPDYAAAARQVDVLLRQEAFVEQTTDFARSLATDPAGMAGLAQALSRNPAWRTPFMTDLRTLRAEDAAGHAALLQALRAGPAPPAPAEVNALLARQIDLGLFDEARALALREGRAVTGRVLPEPAGQAGADPRSFGWDVRIGTGGDAWAEPAAPSPAFRLLMRAEGTMIGPVLVRETMLGAGPARLLWSGREETDGAGRALRWTVRCAGSEVDLPAAIAPLRSGAGGQVEGALAFTVPTGCPLQTVTARLTWQDGGRFGLVVDRIEVR